MLFFISCVSAMIAPKQNNIIHPGSFPRSVVDLRASGYKLYSVDELIALYSTFGRIGHNTTTGEMEPFPEIKTWTHRPNPMNSFLQVQASNKPVDFNYLSIAERIKLLEHVQDYLDHQKMNNISWFAKDQNKQDFPFFATYFSEDFAEPDEDVYMEAIKKELHNNNSNTRVSKIIWPMRILSRKLLTFNRAFNSQHTILLRELGSIISGQSTDFSKLNASFDYLQRLCGMNKRITLGNLKPTKNIVQDISLIMDEFEEPFQLLNFISRFIAAIAILELKPISSTVQEKYISDLFLYIKSMIQRQINKSNPSSYIPFTI